MAYALARSPGDIPPTYPILGPFLAKLIELGIQSDLKISRGYEKASVNLKHILFDIDSVMDSFLVRYNISRQEILSFHNEVNNITTLPAILSHSVFEKLKIDYE